MVSDLAVLLYPRVHLVVPHHVRVARRPASPGPRPHVVSGRRIGVTVDRGPVNPGRGRRRRRRMQRVDKSNSADARLGIGSTLNVRSAAAGTGYPAPTTQEAAARRPAAGKGGQLIGERGGVAAVVVGPTHVEQSVDCRPDVDERVAGGRADEVGLGGGQQYRRVRRYLHVIHSLIHLFIHSFHLLIHLAICSCICLFIFLLLTYFLT